MTALPERFSPRARGVVESGEHQLFLSAASAWEIAIKHAIGRLKLPEPPERFVLNRLDNLGVRPLPIEHRHALHVSTLPPHHRDLFDRMLVAQSQLENLVLLTADPQFAQYEISTLPA
jgi:PIN domain nuclease of toxin-antitoxin system